MCCAYYQSYNFLDEVKRLQFILSEDSFLNIIKIIIISIDDHMGFPKM